MTRLMTGRVAAFAIIATSLIALIRPAASQQPTDEQREAIRSACRSDYIAHCSSVPPGGKPAFECLKTNMASLSSACQKAVNAIGAPPPAGKSSTENNVPEKPAATASAPAKEPAATPSAQATRPPSASANPSTTTPAVRAAKPAATGTATTAPSVPPAQGQATAGVAAAAPPLLPALTPRQEMRLVRFSCGNDFRTYCSAVPLGGGRVMECLRTHAASLSPACQGALADLAGPR